MSQYLTRKEEKQIRTRLDDLAEKLGLLTDKKESYFSGFYIDRLWYKSLEEKRIPFVAFEIERSVPNNERLRKDILNLAWSRVPQGYIIIPHSRILKDPLIEKGSTFQNWYKYRFYTTFQEYYKPFTFYIDIKLVDADAFSSSRSLVKSLVFQKELSN